MPRSAGKSHCEFSLSPESRASALAISALTAQAALGFIFFLAL